MKFFNSHKADHSNPSTAVPSNNNSFELTNGSGLTDIKKSGPGAVGKVPGVTIRTVFMALLVAMGGFIFGYDTGQISGFLEMTVFLERFGQRVAVSEKNPSGYAFNNVRSGLIVAMVQSNLRISIRSIRLTIPSSQLALSSDAWWLDPSQTKSDANGPSPHGAWSFALELSSRWQ